MFMIQSAQRSREPDGRGRFRSGQDFSVRAYQQLNADHARDFLPNAVRALGRKAGRFMRHLLDAMYESRREQAMMVLRRYRALIDVAGQARSPVSQMAGRTRGMSFPTGGCVDQTVQVMRIRCSITGAPCEGDRAYLCDEWGCARKGGLSPISHENA